MTWTPSSPITGAPQTGLTSPTYTIVADSAPATNAKQYYVSALGGTQTGVLTHSASSPFTIAFYRPQQIQFLGVPDPVTGRLRNVPFNIYSKLVKKAMLPLAGQAYSTGWVKIQHALPAGVDLADSIQVRAMLSLAYGDSWANSSATGDSVLSGTL